ncbi:hypothetical protein CVD28_03135 [Bacillus sp. M6-12]|uniref:hypothetical protein n=1 Tax=Bacillus sp. M6-12 TaxID=2054166 RepID=UPI000C75938A|nr:hypothetical protein [Bacillus sp. M6-12]PLS19424.1 hypothetical protein CVD28_03135 [Bacillus sp. M6-12]
MDDFQVSHQKLSIEEQVSHVIKTVKDRWLHSYPYSTENAIEFVSKHPEKLLNKEMFRVHALYLNMLFRSLTKKDSLIKNEEVLNEVAHWDNKGGLCIYLSVLMYSLLLEDKVANRNELRYIQGFTTYQSQNPFWKLVSSDTTMLNFHAWLSYKDSVLDFSIGQERENIQLGEKDYLVGDIPEGMKMVGFKENHKTVQKYVKMFADYRKMNEKEWVLEHKLQGLTCMVDSLEYISKQKEG